LSTLRFFTLLLKDLKTAKGAAGNFQRKFYESATPFSDTKKALQGKDTQQG